MNKNKEIIFVPHEGVGDYILGVPVQSYIESGKMALSESIFDNDKYMYVDEENDIAVFIDNNGLITTIMCDDKFIFNGINLIGKNLDQAIRIIGMEPDEIDEPYEMPDDTVEVNVSFFSIGLDFRLRDTIEGLIIRASVAAAEDYNEDLV